jgi:hypothetical protein
MRLRLSILVLALVLIVPILAAAGADSQSADAKPMLKVKPGEKFSYVTTKAEAAGPRPGFAEPRGKAMISPLPNRQTVVVGETTPCDGHTCLKLSAEQDLPPFVPGLKADSFGKKIKAMVDLQTGDVLDIRTTLTMGSSVSDSTEARYQPESTVAEFYGPWMTDLKDGYNKTFNIASTGEVRVFRVSGREKVAGHDCFVVERIRHLPSNQTVEAKLWVDTARRIALKVEQEGQTMTLAP